MYKIVMLALIKVQHFSGQMVQSAIQDQSVSLPFRTQPRICQGLEDPIINFLSHQYFVIPKHAKR